MTGYGNMNEKIPELRKVKALGKIEECKFLKWLLDPDLGWEHEFCTIYGEKTYLFDTQECNEIDCENYESNQD